MKGGGGRVGLTAKPKKGKETRTKKTACKTIKVTATKENEREREKE